MSEKDQLGVEEGNFDKDEKAVVFKPHSIMQC